MIVGADWTDPSSYRSLAALGGPDVALEYDGARHRYRAWLEDERLVGIARRLRRDVRSMSTAEGIRNRVREFWKEHAHGMREEDAFAAWFLHKKFKLPPQQATSQSSDGNYDGGIDGFHLVADEPVPTLWIVQAKYSEGYPAVVKGVQDLARAVKTTADLIGTGDTLKSDENRVLRNLRLCMARATCRQESVALRFVLVHLNRQDREVWASNPKLKDQVRAFTHEASTHGFAGRAELDYLGPGELDFVDVVVPRPVEPIPMRFAGTPVGLAGTTCWFGLVHLADLVALYDRYRTDLFAKNVRMYLYDKADREQGAARQMRATLEKICQNGGLTGDDFALLHNGVALWAKGLRETDTPGTVLMDPGPEGIFVLNGCQTIYTAWHLREKAGNRDEVWQARWETVRLPARILVTDGEDLVRSVTISTNRQNQIPSSALWAHDPVQIDIDGKFERIGVFYERQEGAYEHRVRSDPRTMADRFPNTAVKLPVGIVALAQALAAADRATPLTYAVSPQSIFESESVYHRVFSENHVSSARLMLLFFNLFRTVHLALREIKSDAGRNNPYSWSAPGRLGIPAFRLCVHYMAAKTDRAEWAEYARSTAQPMTSLMREMRENVKGILRRSSILELLRKHWFDKSTGAWAEYRDKQRMSAALGHYAWGNADPFADWDVLDADGDQD